MLLFCRLGLKNDSSGLSHCPRGFPVLVARVWKKVSALDPSRLGFRTCLPWWIKAEVERRGPRLANSMELRYQPSRFFGCLRAGGTPSFARRSVVDDLTHVPVPPRISGTTYLQYTETRTLILGFRRHPLHTWTYELAGDSRSRLTKHSLPLHSPAPRD